VGKEGRKQWSTFVHNPTGEKFEGVLQERSHFLGVFMSQLIKHLCPLIV